MTNLTNLTNKETLLELSSLMPEYKNRLSEATSEYKEAKKDGVFTEDTITALDEFIDISKETLTKMDRCIELAKNIPENDPILEDTVKELNGYHQYILDADMYILVFIKSQYEVMLDK